MPTAELFTVLTENFRIAVGPAPVSVKTINTGNAPPVASEALYVIIINEF